MTLHAPVELLAAARRGGFAIGYFESWNLESLQGVIDAAEETRSPVIIGFNGEFLTHPGRQAEERIEVYAGLGRAVAEGTSIPCCLIFNECPSDPAVRQAVQAGFNLVMLSDPQATLDDYTQRVAAITSFAHAHGAAVEADAGELPSGASGQILEGHSRLTDPAGAARFTAQTGVDLLSVSVGNVHVLLDGRRGLDLERLAQIHHRVDLPLSLHGGTGIASDALREAIHLGVAKVAYGTYLKQRYLAALRQALGSAEIDPHRLLGMGGSDDILVAGRRAVREAVLERIELLGCCGKV